jgi:hypothetical protein
VASCSWNPADLATCGMSMEQLTQENVWTNGPEFLLQESTEWPEPKGTGSYVPSEEVSKESRVTATTTIRELWHGLCDLRQNC